MTNRMSSIEAHDIRLRHRQRPDDLLHEERLRMRRGSWDLHSAGRQINH
jgi:hypothetical protein